MKKTLLLFFFSTLILNSQEYIQPTKKISFGLNNHTNRDISYFSIIDNSSNLISIATTENDSTFTNILTSKFDNDLNLLWQQNFTFETNLSYDIPRSVHVDNLNNIYVSMRSSSNQSTSNGDAIVLKYNSNGNEEWVLNLTQNLGLDVFDFRYFKMYLTESGSIKVIYSPALPYQSTYYFLTIDLEGNIVNSSQISIEPQQFIENYINNKHVLFYNTFDTSDVFVRIIDSTDDLTYQLNNHPNYENNFNPNNLQSIKFLTDENHNNYLVWQQNNVSGNDQYFVMRIDNNGDISYSNASDPNVSSTLIDTFINSSNRLCILSNNTTITNPNDPKLTLVEYDEIDSNIINSEVADVAAGSIKINNDNSLLVFTNTDEISLFNEDLTLINQFTVSANNIIDDITKLSNSEIITSETSLDKMYPESDFFTQLDVVINKYNPSQLTQTYTYSGIGTSKAFNQSVHIDKNGNYVVLSQEKLGPDNFSIGGSRAPLYKSITKYNSELEILWTLNVPNFLFIDGDNVLIDSSNNIIINTQSEGGENFQLLKISEGGNVIYNKPSFQSLFMFFDANENINLSSGFITNPNTYDEDIEIYKFNNESGDLISTDTFESQAFLGSYISQNNDSYIFIYHPNDQGNLTNQKVSIYKNMSLEFEVILNLESNNSKVNYSSVKINEEGTLFFTTSWGSNDNKLHQITISNNYNSIDLNNKVTQLEILNDGKIFTIANLISNSEGFIEIYNDDLSLFTTNSEIIFNGSFIFTLGEYVFLNSYYNNLVKVYDYNAHLIDEFKIVSNLAYAEQISETSLVLTGQFGNQISTFQDYSWARGLLHVYEYIEPIDDDMDGIGNSIDLCANTPMDEEVNSFGCSQSQLDDDNDGVNNNIDQCPETPENIEVNENGCAEQELDDDNDGITNDIDLCPQTTLTEFVDSQGCFYLPQDNFTIQITGETCLNENNGSISISAIATIAYRTTIDGSEYSFNDSLSIESLAPGTYELCIYVDEENYQQCYNIQIESGIDLDGRTAINSNSLNMEIDSGTPPYSVFLNDELKLVTMQNSFSLNVKQNDRLLILSNRACEGKIENKIDLTGDAYLVPNPNNGLFQVVFNSEILDLSVRIFNTQGSLIFDEVISTVNSKIELNIEDYANGLYFVKLGEANSVYLKLIKN